MTHIFDFDMTLANTGKLAFKDYMNTEKITNAPALPLAEKAATLGKVMILTARSTKNGVGTAIAEWCAARGIDAKVVGVADLFSKAKVEGKRGMRKANTAEKKVMVLQGVSRKVEVTFYDDNAENCDMAEKVVNVKVVRV